MEMVRDGKHLYFGKWHEHIEAWRANPYKASILTIKYEDLYENSTREMLRFCEFAGIQRDPGFVERMTRANTFEEMQKKEARERVHADPNWPTEVLFRRRGKVGCYKDEMPAPVLEAFLAQAGAALRLAGYL